MFNEKGKTVLFFAITGAGNGFIYGPAHVILVHYFDKRRSLANGIAASGASLGVFIVPPIMTYCISVYGIRGTCLILAGLHLNLTAAGSLLRPISFFDRQRENSVDKFGQTCDSNEPWSTSKSYLCDGFSSQTPIVSKKKPNLAFIKNPRFWMYTIGFFANIGGYSFVLFFFPKFAGEIGIDKFWISMLLSGGGIVQLFFQIFSGIYCRQKIHAPCSFS